MILKSLRVVFLVAAALPLAVSAVVGQDPAPAARRIAATAQLAAQEYRIGVVDGKIVAAAEVDEARLFLEEARRGAATLPAELAGDAVAALDTLARLVARTAEPDTVGARVQALRTMLAERLGITLDELPAFPPSLARGEEVYRANCASCHGDRGAGDGPAAAGLDPAPADLTDADALRDQSPLDYFHRITLGVVGTAMPSFESQLSTEDRWAAAAYATLLRLPRPQGEVPDSLQRFAVTGKLSDDALLATLGGADSADAYARLAAVRSVQADATAVARQTFALVRAQLDSAHALARAGEHQAAGAKALDAYMSFEQVERSVRAQSADLAAELESAFAAFRTQAAGGASVGELDRTRADLAAALERAERTFGEPMSPTSLFFQSFVILLREGLEAILVVGALMTFLVKTGAGHRRRDIHLGIGAAVVASLLTAVALETVFQLSPASQEALEGATMLVATVVLFYVSYWLLSKMEVAKWNQFVKSRVHDAVTGGSTLALASAAFLAVYREGFETVLFYKALFVAGGGSAGLGPVLGGIAVGAVVLAGVYVAINRFGVRLPLKPFFGVTSAFLYAMAFIFAGKGIAELQEGGSIPITVVSWAPRIPALGIYPTVESLAVQGVLLVLLVAALVWTFVLAPRRLRVTSVMVPEPAAEHVRAERASAARNSGPDLDLLRSLERMEADLAELRAEVERMRGHLMGRREQSVRG